MAYYLKLIHQTNDSGMDADSTLSLYFVHEQNEVIRSILGSCRHTRSHIIDKIGRGTRASGEFFQDRFQRCFEGWEHKATSLITSLSPLL